MSEQEPYFNLDMGNGEKVRCDAENTTLYTFIGKTAIGDIIFDNSALNHVYVELEETDEDNNLLGMYFFERFHNLYQQMAEFIGQNEFPMVLNSREVLECDLRAYMRQVDIEVQKFSSKIPDSLPHDLK